LRRVPVGGHNMVFAEYKNVPAIIGTLISKKIATLNELSTVYGVKDAYDMLEIITVNDYNIALARQEK